MNQLSAIVLRVILFVNKKTSQLVCYCSFVCRGQVGSEARSRDNHEAVAAKSRAKQSKARSPGKTSWKSKVGAAKRKMSKHNGSDVVKTSGVCLFVF